MTTSILEIDSYYKLFGLPNPTTDIEKIKYTYKQLVLKYHPDKKGGNEDIFKKIQNAYEFLVSQYNQISTTAVSQPYQGKCSDINLILEMTLEEFYNGKKTPMIITHDKICPKCQGMGHLQLSNESNQPCHCAPPHPPTCSFCLGTNVLLTPQNLCGECKGIRIIKHRQQLDIQLPPGLSAGEKLTILNAGNEYPNKARGKVYLVIKESQNRHPYFTRKGNDLHINQQIYLTDALGGHQFQLTLLDQRRITIQTTGVIIPNQTKTIGNLGMTVRNRPRKRGNLVIHFQVIFPKGLISYENKVQLQRFIGQPGSKQEVEDQSIKIFKI